MQAFIPAPLINHINPSLNTADIKQDSFLRPFLSIPNRKYKVDRRPHMALRTIDWQERRWIPQTFPRSYKPTSIPSPRTLDSLIPFKPHGLDKVYASSTSNPILILPGFVTCSSDYSDAHGVSQASLELSLKSRGYQVETVQMERADWIMGLLAGLFTRGFWSKKCTVQESYSWYVKKVDQAVERLLQNTPGAKQVDLVAHSAGGWLARAYLGGAAALSSAPRIKKLITLGTPHVVYKKTDPTRGVVDWVNQMWPNAYFADQGIEYITVAGRSVKGRIDMPKGQIPKFAGLSYATIAGGSGHGIVGDAVVPLESALGLEGAKKIIIDGIYHTMSEVGTLNKPSNRPWYGSDNVIDAWLSQI